MLKEIRTPGWKSVTEECSKSKESGNGFCCVGLCGPSPLWYTHLLVFWTFQDVWLSTVHLSFLREFFFLGTWCAKRFKIWPWQFLQRFLDKNDIRLVGVQEFKSLCTHIFCGSYTFHICQLRRTDFHNVKDWRRSDWPGFVMPGLFHRSLFEQGRL